MGLFGGFKAKFTRNSTNKKPPEVVCLRYHVHAEFDTPDSNLIPPRINNDVKKTEVVRNGVKKKERKALTKSAIFPDNHTSQSSLSSSTPQKSLSLNNLNGDASSSVVTQQNGHSDLTDPITVSTMVTSNSKDVAISDTKFGRSIEEHNGVTTEKVAMITNTHVYGNESEKYSQTTFQKVSSYNEDGALTNGGAAYMSNSEITYTNPSTHNESSIRENGHKHLDADQSTLIFMTQHSSRSSSFDSSHINFNRTVNPINSNKAQENFNGATENGNTNLTFVPKHATLEDDADYFKVNVVRHDLNRTYSMSEDERSVQEEEPQFTKMGFSSHAASIFFGDGEEAEVARPRRIQFAENDDEDERRRSSGADC